MSGLAAGGGGRGGRELEAELLEFVSRQLAGPGVEVGPESRLVEAIDSTAFLELVVWLEATQGVAVASEDMTPENLGTVRRIVGFVEARRGAGGAG